MTETETNNNISVDIFMKSTEKPSEALVADSVPEMITSSSDAENSGTEVLSKQIQNSNKVESWPVYSGKPRGDGSTNIVELKNVTHIFNAGRENEYVLFKDFNLILPDLPGQSQIFTIMGQSGCGKSQLLKAIAGLNKFNSGEIFINGKKLDDNYHPAIPGIFQEATNYVWLTVKENVMLPMTVVNKMSKETASEYADKLLDIVGLTEHANKYPNKLSGGQQQRVALARSFATNSPIIFCDESTSRLDPKMKKSVQLTLLKMSYRAEFDTTCICVSHDVSEAAFISNRVIILKNDGKTGCHVYKEIDIYYPGEETRERGEWILDTPEYAEYVRTISHYLNEVCR